MLTSAFEKLLKSKQGSNYIKITRTIQSEEYGYVALKRFQLRRKSIYRHPSGEKAKQHNLSRSIFTVVLCARLAYILARSGFIVWSNLRA